MNRTSLFLIALSALLPACAALPLSPRPSPTPDAKALQGMIREAQGDSGAHDPTILKEGSIYYRFSTGHNIPISCSPDLVNWTHCGSVFLAKPGWLLKAVPGVADLWAPDVAFINGKYYLYYAASTFGSNLSAIGLVTSPTLDPKSPDYLWSDLGPVLQSTFKDNFNAIDPNIVVEAPGKLWLAYGSYWSGIKLRRLDPETGLLPAGDSEVFAIASRLQPPYAVEGAFILPHKGEYFLFVSFDQCCNGVNSTYKIMVGRSKVISGPYLDRDGKPLTAGGGSLVLDGDAHWRGPGHNSVLTDGDKLYLVYHAYDATAAGTPKLRVEEIVWDGQGWPQSPSYLLRSSAK